MKTLISLVIMVAVVVGSATFATCNRYIESSNGKRVCLQEWGMGSGTETTGGAHSSADLHKLKLQDANNPGGTTSAIIQVHRDTAPLKTIRKEEKK